MSWNFFSRLFGSERRLGVDIGTASIKIVEVTQSGNGKTVLHNYGYLESAEYLERSNAAFHASTLQLDERTMGQYLRALVKQSNLRDAPCVASIPAFHAFTTLIETPPLSDKELAQSIPLQAKQYIPLPMSEHNLDWMNVGERVDDDGTKKIQLLLIAIPKEVVARYQTIFKNAGLDLASLELESVSLARALTTGKPGLSLIMDIGSRSSSVAVAQNGLLQFAAQTDFAGASLTQTIATGLKLGMQRAEEMKRHRGLAAEGGEYELFTLLQPIVDAIINEGKRVKSNYETAHRATIDRVIISGGGANLPGLDRYVAQELGLVCEHADPFARLELPAGMDAVQSELGPLFSVAVGLGLKKLE